MRASTKRQIAIVYTPVGELANTFHETMYEEVTAYPLCGTVSIVAHIIMLIKHETNSATIASFSNWVYRT